MECTREVTGKLHRLGCEDRAVKDATSERQE
jgi:hypothetical protein